jgi:hypothetical protein
LTTQETVIRVAEIVFLWFPLVLIGSGAIFAIVTGLFMWWQGMFK